MPERIAVTTLVIGHLDHRTTINPGEMFDSDKFGMSADELRQLDETEPAVVRLPQGTPRAEPSMIEPTEGRSGPVAGATSDPGAADAGPDRPATKNGKPADPDI